MRCRFGICVSLFWGKTEIYRLRLIRSTGSNELAIAVLLLIELFVIEFWCVKLMCEMRLNTNEIHLVEFDFSFVFISFVRLNGLVNELDASTSAVYESYDRSYSQCAHNVSYVCNNCKWKNKQIGRNNECKQIQRPLSISTPSNR